MKRRKRQTPVTQSGNDKCAVCGMECKNKPSTPQTAMIKQARDLNTNGAILKHPQGGRLHPRCDFMLYKYIYQELYGKTPPNDTATTVTVAHAPTCPVAQPGFVFVEGLRQCNCDFMQRLG